MTGVDFLKALGFSKEALDNAQAYVFGASSFDGLASLRPEHAAVFSAPVSPEDPMVMACTLQPCISGGVGLKLMLPASTSLDEIARLIRLAASLHLKMMIFGREGARLSDPACGALFSDLVFEEPEAPAQRELITQEADDEEEAPVHPLTPDPLPSVRRRLPDRRKGYIQKASVGGHKVYLHTGEFDHGELGEIFIDMHKEGAAFRSLMNNFAIAISRGTPY